jgi:hypothetical protein
MAKDITSLTGADLFAALISSEKVVVDNRKKKGKPSTTPKAKSTPSLPRLNGDAREEMEKLSEEKRLRNLISGMPDREWKPIGISLMIQQNTCLTCGSFSSAPLCEVPMLKLRKKNRDDSKATIYVRLDHRIPAIHAKLPRRIQRNHKFIHSCEACFEETPSTVKEPK